MSSTRGRSISCNDSGKLFTHIFVTNQLHLLLSVFETTSVITN